MAAASLGTGSLTPPLLSVLPLQAVPQLPGHPDKGHHSPQPAVASGEDGRGHPHGHCVLPLDTCQQRGAVGHTGQAWGPGPMLGAGAGHSGEAPRAVPHVPRGREGRPRGAGMGDAESGAHILFAWAISGFSEVDTQNVTPHKTEVFIAGT